MNQRWRICFRWQDGHAHEVEFVDYPFAQFFGTDAQSWLNLQSRYDLIVAKDGHGDDYDAIPHYANWQTA